VIEINKSLSLAPSLRSGRWRSCFIRWGMFPLFN
jgi:hypothetical protein